MRRRRNILTRAAILISLTFLVSIAACELPGAFESDKELGAGENSEATYEAPEMVRMHTTGGYAGVNRLFTVEDNGEVALTGYSDCAECYFELNEEQLGDLSQLFLDNGFFQLDDEYSANARDVFIYELTFGYHGLTKTVMADGLSAPEELLRILDGLQVLIDELLQRKPLVSLELDKTTMAPGDTLHMRLLVANPLAEPMTLRFNTSQVYDFFVKSSTNATDQDATIWNWAYDKDFAQVITNLVLEANETRVYEEIWTGHTNRGAQAVGEFEIGAILVSTPGGVSPEHRFEIRRPQLFSRAVVTYGDSLRITISVPDTSFSLIEDMSITVTAENIATRQLKIQTDAETTYIVVARWGTDTPLWQSPVRAGVDYGTAEILNQGQIETYQETVALAWANIECNMAGDYAVWGRVFDLPTGKLRIRITP